MSYFPNENNDFDCEKSIYHSALEEFENEKVESDEEENYYTYLHPSRMNSTDYYSSL